MHSLECRQRKYRLLIAALLYEMKFPVISGEPKYEPTPPPKVCVLLLMMFCLIVGEENEMATPPPVGGKKDPTPFVNVNPFNIDFLVSPEVNVAAGPILLASIIVTLGPLVLLTVIAFPLKLTFSSYVPGDTNTESPLLAALIPA
ncbi:MAG: hypothetical protein M3O09_18755 [Acidobacteriota bacterium]|nr:hypothetical protein [Acidobacteriota bacterium]